MGDEDGERSSAEADAPTVAHQLFAPPSAAEATFGDVAAGGPPPDGGAGERVVDDDDGTDEGDDDSEPERRVSFATKALLVAAAWVLLVLFLTGRFTDDDDPGAGPVGLDQTNQVDGAGVDAGSPASEEPVDVDGDGEIEPGEPGFGASGAGVGASGGADGAGSAEVTGAPGGTGTGGSGPGGAGGDPPGEDSTPVALPGSRATTTTAKPGAASPTSTTADPNGGPTPTAPSPTSTTEPFDGEVVRISDACTFDRDAVAVSAGAVTVRFVNDSSSAKVIRYLGTNHTVAAHGQLDRTFSHDRTVDCRAGGVTTDELAIDVDA